MDLNDLLARLKTSENQATSNGHSGQTASLFPAQSSDHQHPFVSSSLLPTPLASPQPHSANNLAAGILSSSNVTTSDRMTSERTTNLLNLLKFNQPGSATGISGQTGQGLRDNESLRASSMSTMTPSSSSMLPLGIRNEARQVSLGVPPAMGRDESLRLPVGENPQDALLKLLGRSQGTTSSASKPVANTDENIKAEIDGQGTTDAAKSDTTVRVFGGQENHKDSAFEPSQPNPSGSVFTYINPFEQLAASSPRNKKTKLGGLSGSATPEAGLKPDLTATSSTNADAKFSAPGDLPNGRTQVEALLGIGASSIPSETVSQALGEVGEQVDKQAQEALARAGIESDPARDNSGPEASNNDTTFIKDLQKAVHEVALEINNELKDEMPRASIVASVADRVANAMEDTTNGVAHENIADSWESADAEDNSTKDDDNMGVRVFNFPMKPFVSIDIKNLPTPARVVRQDIVMKIASMKKEFDQVDRTLASATANFIVYAMAKGGGLRIIRQDDGANKQVFRKVEHKIYNVSISAPSSSALSKSSESILATGVNGSVYWTSVSLRPGDAFEEEDLDRNGFIFPPLASSDENTSGALLKTRAKQSSRHPEFFAVSRGKSIHIIWPSLASSSRYIDAKTRVVDSGKYFSECCLKIATGKSGKDFAFSEDDTVIVSLDKAGRLKFWDIREHTTTPENVNAESHRHVETKQPLLVLTTTSAAEKSWATSVQFVDMERPKNKGLALRYLLVGSKQNHTLQLWDIGLGQPVQELNFPHENETDAICSVTYHAKTGIVAVGHPTRNSIFLIHLSSPRYNLGGIGQAEYIQRLASKDPSLPKRDSTAIMSGLREISLSSMGLLRSLEIGEKVATSTGDADEGGETVFEVYVSTSRGVSSVSLKKEDLGWNQEGKVINGVDADAENIVELRTLQMPQMEESEGNEVSTQANEPSAKTELDTPNKEVTKPASKEKTPSSAGKKASQLPSDATNPKSMMKHEAEANNNPPVEALDRPAVIQSVQKVTDKKTTSNAPNKVAKPKDDTSNLTPEHVPNSVAAKPMTPRDLSTEHTQQLDTAMLGESISKALGDTLSTVFGTVLGDQLESLYKRFDDDKRVHDAAGAARQDAILRLISSTLTDNVEKSLSRIVTTNIQQSILPALHDGITAHLERTVGPAINQHLSATIPSEIKSALQEPITQAMQHPEVLRTITDQVSGKVANHVEHVFSSVLLKNIQPAFQKLAVDTARKSTAEVERRVAEQLKGINVQRQNDTAKIDQLTTLTTELLDTVRTMAKNLSDSQNEISKIQAQLAERERAVPVPAKAVVAPVPPAAPRDDELEILNEMMSTGRLADGTIKWLQSTRRVELFDLFFVKYDPIYLQGMDQLITLSVTAAVTDSFENHLPERLRWLEVALNATDTKNPAIVEYATKVLEVLVQRLMDAYMTISETDPKNSMLGKIHALVRQARLLRA